jgi:uncharacterized protein (DUF2267 family)
MSLSGIEAFERSTHESNVWLKDLKSTLGTEDSHVAYGVLRAGLHTLRDRIGPENAVHLGAQLPMLLRGLYYEGWRLAATPTRERHRAQFLEHVSRELRGQGAIDPEAAIRAVFEVLWDRIDAGEVAKVIDLFPAELRELWPRLARGD